MNRLNILPPKFHSRPPSSHRLASLGLLAGLCCASIVHAQVRFSYSADGAEVNDAKTGLIWQRCSAGQTWSGSTCVGTAVKYTHEAALGYAKTQTGFRLPSVKDLTSLVDRTVGAPSIDSVAFPVTPATVYWSASPFVADSAFAWVVYFNHGYVGYDIRYLAYQVRLVR